MNTTWPSRYTRRATAIQSSAIRELLKLTQKPDMISFAGGLPAPELFPIAEIQSACTKVLAEQGASVVVNYASSKAGADRVVGEINGSGGRAIAVQADVSKPADIRRLFAEAKKALAASSPANSSSPTGRWGRRLCWRGGQG